MPQIDVEFPKGQRSAEMLLVEMLRDKRSWQDHSSICQALWNIRFHAERMKKEDRKQKEEARKEDKPHGTS